MTTAFIYATHPSHQSERKIAKIHWRFSRLLGSLGLLLACLVPMTRAQSMSNGIAATVDGTIITNWELQQRTDVLKRRLKLEGDSRELQEQVLERLILETAQLNLAKTYGMRVSEEQITHAVEVIAAQNKVTVDAFVKVLTEEGSTLEKFRQEVKREILQKQVQEREVAARLSITDAEIQKFLKEQGKKEEEFDLSQILIQTAEGLNAGSLAQKKQRAEQALKRIKNGEDFARVASEMSDAADADKGGNLGWRHVNKLPTLFVDVVGAMKKGEVSDLIRSGNGFHILRVNDRRNADGDKKIVQNKVRHILIRTSTLISPDLALIELKNVLQKLEKKEATFEQLAQEFSQDGSAKNGGDLGWALPGDMVPTFEEAMNKVEVGKISEPVLTQFGYHVLQVTERKEGPIPEARLAQQAKSILFERKYEEGLGDWLSQLRGQIFVENYFAEGL